MSRPIAETPILTGDDARRFDDAINNVKPVSKKEYKKIVKDYQLINCKKVETK